MKTSTAKKGVIGAIIAILIITILEFPPPLGFETRPQGNVSLFWLVFFLSILITELATIPLIFKRASLGIKLGLFAGTANIIQVIADQTHLMQPEVASLGYSILEFTVVFFSLTLMYFIWIIYKSTQTEPA